MMLQKPWKRGENQAGTGRDEAALTDPSRHTVEKTHDVGEHRSRTQTLLQPCSPGKQRLKKQQGKCRGRDRSERKEGRSQVGIAEENKTICVTENRLIFLRFYFYFY